MKNALSNSTMVGVDREEYGLGQAVGVGVPQSGVRKV